MSKIAVYFHDPIEVDPRSSWTGLCAPLAPAARFDIATVSDRRVTALFDYARPDVVITVDGHPVLSIEQTMMNPSGHNIPQRFSFQVRAAELGVPSILYYPERSRRTFSEDANLRNLNPRVPLAQARLSQLYEVPALSVFWPVDKSNLPSTDPASHKQMANLVAALVTNHSGHLGLPEVQQALKDMQRVVRAYASGFRKRTNESVRRCLPNGFATAEAEPGLRVDPPDGAQLETTESFLSSLGSAVSPEIQARLRHRPHTLTFTGTANKNKTDSEHPWPGYLSLLDVLYCRTGHTPADRSVNLCYRLPVAFDVFSPRTKQSPPPTATYIVDTFADLILLDGGVVVGRPMRK